MALAEPPDAIFGVNDAVALAAMQVLNDMGFDVPRQVTVIGFDNSPFSSYFNPPLSTVNRFGKQIGEEAARLFLNNLEAPNPIIESIVLPPELIIRRSTLT
jgi:LacI family transcriptional regulator